MARQKQGRRRCDGARTENAWGHDGGDGRGGVEMVEGLRLAWLGASLDSQVGNGRARTEHQGTREEISRVGATVMVQSGAMGGQW